MTRIVHMTEEMRNDVLFLIEQADALPSEEKYDFQRWTYLRAALIYLVIFAESFINYFSASVARQKEKELDRTIIDFIDKETNQRGRLSLKEKFSLIPALLFNKSVNKESNDFSLLNEAIELRNQLTHFSHSNITKQQKIYNPENISVKKLAEYLNAFTQVIKEIYKISGQTPPSYLSQTKSKRI